MSIQEKFHEIPESKEAKHLMFWLSLAVTTFGLLHVLRQVQKGKGI